MNLAKMIENDKSLKTQFDRIVALEEMANSIDYVQNKNATQEDIDDHATVNSEFVKAIETMGLTPAQYYEIKEALHTKVKTGDIIRVGRLDYKVISAQKLSGRLPGATRGRDNLIIKATKPRGKKVFQIVQYPSGRFSSAVGR